MKRRKLKRNVRLPHEQRYEVAKGLMEGISPKALMHTYDISYATILNIKNEFLDTKLEWKIVVHDPRQKSLWSWAVEKLRVLPKIVF